MKTKTETIFCARIIFEGVDDDNKRLCTSIGTYTPKLAQLYTKIESITSATITDKEKSTVKQQIRHKSNKRKSKFCLWDFDRNEDARILKENIIIYIYKF